MQPDLENLKNKVASNRDYISKISEKLPGYKGYAEIEQLYDVDKILRNFISDKIQSYKNELNSISNVLFKQGQTSILEAIAELSNLLERVLKKCQSADFGGSARLSGMKITDDDKNRLLEFDWRLISTIEELEPTVQQLQPKDADHTSVLKDIEAKIKVFEKSFDSRKNILTEVI